MSSSAVATVLEVMQTRESVIITAQVPRELHSQVRELAEANMGSASAEVRRALARHVATERARVGPPGGGAKVEAGGGAREETS